MRKFIVFSGLMAMTLAGCATTPDPAKVCTAEWIAPRVDRAIVQLRRDTNRLVKSFNSAAKSMDDGTISAWQTYRMVSAVQKYADRVQNSRGMKDLKILSETCDDPQIIRNGFADYLQSVNAPEFLIMMLRDAENFDVPFDLPRTDSPAVKSGDMTDANPGG